MATTEVKTVSGAHLYFLNKSVEHEIKNLKHIIWDVKSWKNCWDNVANCVYTIFNLS